MLDYLTNKYFRKKIFICGDWNLDILNPNHSEHSEELISILKSFNFQLHIQVPTRGESCLDQIASNIKLIESGVHYLGLSDHETAQTVTFKANKQKCFSTWFEYKRDYSADNIKNFCSCISSFSFSEALESQHLQEAFSYFYETFLLFYELCFPIIKVKTSNRPAKLRWMTKGIRESCKNKRQLYLKSRLSK